MKATFQDERDLLIELSFEISNFSDKFKGKVQHTYVLSPFASSLFEPRIVGSEVYVGVPERIFDLMTQVKWYTVSLIAKTAGMFLVFEMGKGEKKHPAAIRVFLRSKQADAISCFDKITFLCCHPNGEPFELSRRRCFDLPIKKEKELAWEKIKLISRRRK
ncbi:hypothetical protein D3C87_849040 [compost metagenome]